MLELLKKSYRAKKKQIESRLEEFGRVWECGDKRVFEELSFCVCTPQSKAVYCAAAVRELVRTGRLYSADVTGIRELLKAVRFPNNKARFIVHNRELLSSSGKISIKKHIDPADIMATRDWLVRNIKGIGYKEASHFLRNIGFGGRLAILDVHILRNLVKFGVLREIPKSLSRGKYIELERKAGRFADKAGIPMDHLDLLFWSEQTGMIFK
jgi:N-glycosylase/DNA lyase